ncbi:undecaprenyl-diphosphatase [Eubacterium ruminantium]|nr:undecaprenyl-diphosphatase [Eubacterium ruminantium]
MKKKYIVSAIFGILFFIVMIMVKTVDVAPIGPEGSKIGLSKINKAVHKAFGVNESWDKITEILGVLIILVGLVFAFLGLKQLIERKSLLKVDKEILALGVLYVVIGLIYVIFEKIVINYRPVILSEKEGLEASFPSSHTVLACVVAGSVIVLAGKYIKKSELRVAARLVLTVLLLITVVGRLVAGIHWFTDILAGALLSAALIALFMGVIEGFSE